MPWWQERIYLEGLVSRSRRERALSGSHVPAEPVVHEVQEPEPSGDRYIQLSDVGANVRHVQFG